MVENIHEATISITRLPSDVKTSWMVLCNITQFLRKCTPRIILVFMKYFGLCRDLLSPGIDCPDAGETTDISPLEMPILAFLLQWQYHGVSWIHFLWCGKQVGAWFYGSQQIDSFKDILYTGGYITDQIHNSLDRFPRVLFFWTAGSCAVNPSGIRFVNSCWLID